MQKYITFPYIYDDQQFGACLGPLFYLLARRYQPLLKLTVEKINGENPCDSPYLHTLALHYDLVSDSTRVFLGERLR